MTSRGSSEYLKLLGYKRFHFRSWPNRSGGRVVFLHGHGESSEIWTQLAEEVSDRLDVVAVDLRGHGGTPWDPDLHYDFAEFVEDLRLQLEHWSRRCVLVGHGLGGHVALAAGQAFKSLLDGLVVMEVDPLGESTRTPIGVIFDEYASQAPDSGARYRVQVWAKLYSELTWAQPGRGRRPKCDPALFATARAPEVRPVLGAGVDLPVLVVRGRSSSGVSADSARVLAGSLADGTYVEVGGGIWPHVDATAGMAELVMRFSGPVSQPENRVP